MSSLPPITWRNLPSTLKQLYGVPEKGTMPPELAQKISSKVAPQRRVQLGTIELEDSNLKLPQINTMTEFMVALYLDTSHAFEVPKHSNFYYDLKRTNGLKAIGFTIYRLIAEQPTENEEIASWRRGYLDQIKNRNILSYKWEINKARENNTTEETAALVKELDLSPNPQANTLEENLALLINGFDLKAISKEELKQYYQTEIKKEILSVANSSKLSSPVQNSGEKFIAKLMQPLITYYQDPSKENLAALKTYCNTTLSGEQQKHFIAVLKEMSDLLAARVLN